MGHVRAGEADILEYGGPTLAGWTSPYDGGAAILLPQRTDGRLVKDNLWKEAGVSRTTMNRARLIMAERDARVALCGGMTPGEARKYDELDKLRKELAEKTRKCTQLHQQFDAAATAIAALHHDNTLLREELDRTGKVVALDKHRGTRETSTRPEPGDLA